MATIYASLVIDLNGVAEDDAKDAVRSAVEGIGGYVLDATLSGMIIEADDHAAEALQQTIADALDSVGCELQGATIVPM